MPDLDPGHPFSLWIWTNHREYCWTGHMPDWLEEMLVSTDREEWFKAWYGFLEGAQERVMVADRREAGK